MGFFRCVAHSPHFVNNYIDFGKENPNPNQTAYIFNLL